MRTTMAQAPLMLGKNSNNVIKYPCFEIVIDLVVQWAATPPRERLNSMVHIKNINMFTLLQNYYHKQYLQHYKIEKKNP